MFCELSTEHSEHALNLEGRKKLPFPAVFFLDTGISRSFENKINFMCKKYNPCCDEYDKRVYIAIEHIGFQRALI